MESDSAEARVLLAIQAIKKEPKLPVWRAAKIYNVAASTLRDRLKGRPPRGAHGLGRLETQHGGSACDHQVCHGNRKTERRTENPITLPTTTHPLLLTHSPCAMTVGSHQRLAIGSWAPGEDAFTDNLLLTLTKIRHETRIKLRTHIGGDFCKVWTR
ncbi:hypothetical protein EV126DRAFT_409146 [Verticillium dahliae]|nr:hypothetical protein EV126DRAFT_409146 [Verticillium dahliae]